MIFIPVRDDPAIKLPLSAKLEINMSQPFEDLNPSIVAVGVSTTVHKKGLLNLLFFVEEKVCRTVTNRYRNLVVGNSPASVGVCGFHD